MAEVEIHTSHEGGGDAFTKGVSVMVGVIGIVLAFVTIASHRAHTAAVIHRTEANDQWSFYEAKKEREHLMDVAAGLLGVVQVAQADKAQVLGSQYAKERDRYASEATPIQQEAKAREAESCPRGVPGPATGSGRGVAGAGPGTDLAVLPGAQAAVSHHWNHRGSGGRGRRSNQFPRLGARARLHTLTGA